MKKITKDRIHKLDKDLTNEYDKFIFNDPFKGMWNRIGCLMKQVNRDIKKKEDKILENKIRKIVREELK